MDDIALLTGDLKLKVKILTVQQCALKQIKRSVTFTMGIQKNVKHEIA